MSPETFALFRAFVRAEANLASILARMEEEPSLISIAGENVEARRDRYQAKADEAAARYFMALGGDQS